MIYYENSGMDSVFLVEEDYRYFRTLPKAVNYHREYEIYDDFCQTKLAPSVLDSWSS
jgi:hypothetical protein